MNFNPQSAIRNPQFQVSEQPFDMNPIRQIRKIGEERDVAAELIEQAFTGEPGPAIDGTPFRVASIDCIKSSAYLYFEIVRLSWIGAGTDVMILTINYRDGVAGDPLLIHDPNSFRATLSWAEIFFGRRLPLAFWQIVQSRSADRPAPGFMIVLPIDADRRPRTVSPDEFARLRKHGFKSHAELVFRCRFESDSTHRSPHPTSNFGNDGASFTAGYCKFSMEAI